ncbi:proton-coupled folate transporter-like [Pomacea canaliculata]|uniref:proton-coupled folate transporter-like n=1 Tax=Pomacea canaliculata TaxID=400727 RepID=UPI000D729596|nr:proton-coupled folate transporter-like [Pomacea canaliculata]
MAAEGKLVSGRTRNEPSSGHPHGVQCQQEVNGAMTSINLGMSDNEKQEPEGRNLLQRHAFVVTYMMSNMLDDLQAAVKGQFRYNFFHNLYASQLSKFNITRECGVALMPEVQEIENSISRETIQWEMYSQYVTTLPCIVAAFIIALRSDRIGRRLGYLLPYVVMTLDFMLLAVIIRLKLHFGFTLVGDFIKSLSGGYIAMNLTAYALISDTHGKKGEAEKESSPSDNEKSQKEDSDELDMSRENQRALKIVSLTVAKTFLSSLLSLVTGYIIQRTGSFYTLCGVIVLKILLFTFAYTFIAETSQQKKSSGFFAPVKTIFLTTKNPRKRRTLLLVNLAAIFTVVSYVTEFEVMRIYQMSPPFCLNSVDLGHVSSETRFRAIVTIPLLWLWRKIGLTESTIAAIGVVCEIIGTVLLATVRKIWVFFAAPIIAVPGLLCSSMTKIIISRLVGRQALASSFAAMLAIDELFGFAGGQAGSYLYKTFIDTVPTATFYMATATFTVSAIMYTIESILQHSYAKKDASGQSTVPVSP